MTTARPRKRSGAEDQERAIVDAILQLMREGGPASLTTDAIATLAGVSKATIYKKWGSKSELLVHAASLVLTSPTIQDRGSFRAEIRELLEQRAAQYNGELGGHLFAALLGATVENESFRATFADWVAKQMDANYAAVRRGIARGDVRSDCDPKAVSTAIAGPLLYRMVVERSPVDEALIDFVVESVIAIVAPTTTVA